MQRVADKIGSETDSMRRSGDAAREWSSQSRTI